MIAGIAAAQMDELTERFGAVASRSVQTGGALVSIGGIGLPPGWSKASTGIRFLIPTGYPHSRPDSFWADPDLRLAGGLMPQNVQPLPEPDTIVPGLWFSWHLAGAWDPNRDTLGSWVNSILERLRQVR